MNPFHLINYCLKDEKGSSSFSSCLSFNEHQTPLHYRSSLMSHYRTPPSFISEYFDIQSTNEEHLFLQDLNDSSCLSQSCMITQPQNYPSQFISSSPIKQINYYPLLTDIKHHDNLHVKPSKFLSRDLSCSHQVKKSISCPSMKETVSSPLTYDITSLQQSSGIYHRFSQNHQSIQNESIIEIPVNPMTHISHQHDRNDHSQYKQQQQQQDEEQTQQRHYSGSIQSFKNNISEQLNNYQANHDIHFVFECPEDNNKHRVYSDHHEMLSIVGTMWDADQSSRDDDINLYHINNSIEHSQLFTAQSLTSHLSELKDQYYSKKKFNRHSRSLSFDTFPIDHNQLASDILKNDALITRHMSFSEPGSCSPTIHLHAIQDNFISKNSQLKTNQCIDIPHRKKQKPKYMAFLKSIQLSHTKKYLSTTGNDDISQKQTINSYIIEHPSDPLMRRVSNDYPIPSWMIKKKLLSSTYKCPYQYHETFMGEYGVINYHIEGDIQHEIVLCFHGLNGNRLTFYEIQEICSKYQYCVITFDLYGHGLSASPLYRSSYSLFSCQFGSKPATYSLEFFVRQTEQLIEHLGLQDRQLCLIGFSMGGVIASAYAKKHLDQIRLLILISTAGILAPSTPHSVKLLKCCSCCIPFAPKCVCGCCCRRQAFMKKFQTRDIQSGLAETLWSRLMWQLFVKKGVIEAFLGSVVGVPMWSAESIFKEIGLSGLPVLLLWGKDDAVVPVSSAKKVLNCFPNGHLIVLDRCSHLLLADQAQPALAIILTFLEFPKTCQMKQWKYLLPFTSKGVYVPKEGRCPEGITTKEYLKDLNFRPRLILKLPAGTKYTGQEQGAP